MLVWLSDAPVYDGSNEEIMQPFIDKMILCQLNPDAELYPGLSELVDSRQTHNHTLMFFKRSLKRNGKKICRFNIAFFPMKKNNDSLKIT